MMKKYVIFDFNGTIIDDVDLCLNLLNKMLVENGYKEVTLERYRNIFTFPIKKYYELAGFDFTKDDYNKLAIEFINAYQPASLKCNLYAGCRELFRDLKEKGYHLIVLSASERTNLIEQMTHFQILDYFDDILGLDNIHAVSKVMIGVEYLTTHQISPNEVVMIGDTLHDKEVADEMGIDIILVSQGHQSHEVLSVEHNLVVESIGEVKKYL